MMHSTEQLFAEEKIIREYFNSWLESDFSRLDNWFNQDVYYRECYGATYKGLNELKAYINSKSKEQTVLKWDILSMAYTSSNQFVVTWFFDAKEKQEYCFDGVSLIAFSDNKIKSIVEYSTKHETYRPYKDKV